MKQFCIFFALMSAIGGFCQSIIGAWEMESITPEGENFKSVVIFTEGYQVLATYNADTGKFLSTNGGTWKLNGNIMTEKVEFNSGNPDMVGKEVSFEVFINENTMGITGTDMKFSRIDDGTPGKLEGAWLMSARVVNDQFHERDVNVPRKTMKILSGTRFQWIAYNTETKEFMGTGGGTYTTKDGIYTENIKFFSRDDSRVGASLKFDFELEDGNWHHTGFSSKGDPLDEIWSKRI